MLLARYFMPEARSQADLTSAPSLIADLTNCLPSLNVSAPALRTASSWATKAIRWPFTVARLTRRLVLICAMGVDPSRSSEVSAMLTNRNLASLRALVNSAKHAMFKSWSIRKRSSPLKPLAR